MSATTNIMWASVLFVTREIEDGLTAGTPERLPELHNTAGEAMRAAIAALATRPDCHSVAAIRLNQAKNHSHQALEAA